MHEYIPVAVTLVAILAGILMNNADLRELKADMRELKADMNARFDRIEAKQDRMQADLSEIQRVLGSTTRPSSFWSGESRAGSSVPRQFLAGLG